MKKRRSLNQIKEDDSYRILRQKLPEAWVIHEYGPDYGIDCVVELFDYVDAGKTMAETLGENFYVQLKASSSFEYTKRRAFGRGNVALGSLSEDKSDFVDINVVKYQLETSDLLTIQSMGTAVPVLLIVVDVVTERAFFVCLNDYIDKIIIPEDPSFEEKASKVISIPVQNEISRAEEHLVPLRYLGKRAKMLSAFGLFNYQYTEIKRRLGLTTVTYPMRPELEVEMLNTFVNAALRLDIWTNHEFWKPIKDSHKDLVAFKRALADGVPQEQHVAMLHTAYSHIWHKLANLGNMYEELCREWCLPTVLGQLTSYPRQPTIQDVGTPDETTTNS
jgi:hypothetical protein